MVSASLIQEWADLMKNWLPVFGVDVERSFSSYKNILSDRRIALKEESIQMLNFLYFNLGNIIMNY